MSCVWQIAFPINVVRKSTDVLVNHSRSLAKTWYILGYTLGNVQCNWNIRFLTLTFRFPPARFSNFLISPCGQYLTFSSYFLSTSQVIGMMLWTKGSYRPIHQVRAAPNRVQLATLLCSQQHKNTTDIENKFYLFNPSSKTDHAFSPLEVQRLTLHEVSVKTRARSLHVPSVIPVRTVASISIGGVSQESLS
ncbi:hypothetical protein Tco_1015052 [Tanacetum coccineum]|uniref:Uncharacterized protein n=1 Tax=Tanacetum coccineum TaxID=301880 RepID=A0ABQ5FJS3_9ASTR